ncbi:MAG: class I SAM-dependent DNA methyltransferase [Alphaproteobacteria bacterium]
MRSFEEMLGAHCGDGLKRRVLDAGCGSGGLAPTLKKYAQTLDGVDLSPEMIFWAKSQGHYDTLAQEELCAYLRPRKDSYDLVVTAAVLIHFSDLTPVFKRVKAALSTGGLWMFTLFENRDATTDFSVNEFNMFAHSVAYVAGLAERFGFEIVANTKILHEFHGQTPIEAQAYCLRR